MSIFKWMPQPTVQSHNHASFAKPSQAQETLRCQEEEEEEAMMECDEPESSEPIEDFVDIARSVTDQIVTNVSNFYDQF